MQFEMVQTCTEENLKLQIEKQTLIWCVQRKLDIMCFVTGGQIMTLRQSKT